MNGGVKKVGKRWDVMLCWKKSLPFFCSFVVEIFLFSMAEQRTGMYDEERQPKKMLKKVAKILYIHSTFEVRHTQRKREILRNEQRIQHILMYLSKNLCIYYYKTGRGIAQIRGTDGCGKRGEKVGEDGDFFK